MLDKQMANIQISKPKEAAGPDQWVDLYGDYLYRYALARVSDSETAEDIVQEALAAAIQSFERFQGRSSIKTWLVAILKRKIVDHYRRRSNYQETDNVDAIADRIDGLFDDTGHWRNMPGEWASNPVQAYEQKEFMDIMYQCLAGLPKRLAEIFMLREFEAIDTQTICNQMKISQSNSWVMLYRARMQLRACLEENWLDS
jgi:RNA polymerase sigma-70 factor (ECF subfamily)